MRSTTHFAALTGIVLGGCASGQLNYNTLELASTVDNLLTRQVDDNIAKFIKDRDAIPSQIILDSGTATTTASVTPNISFPFNNSVALTNSVASTASSSPSTQRTLSTLTTTPGVSGGVNASDGWNQTWAFSPIIDTDKLRRMRALYRFAIGATTRGQFLCEYPVVEQTSGGGGGGGTNATVSVPTTDGNIVTVRLGGSDTQDSTTSGTKYYKPHCTRAGNYNPANKDPTQWLSVKPDPAFLKRPSCVICESLAKPIPCRPGVPTAPATGQVPLADKSIDVTVGSACSTAALVVNEKLEQNFVHASYSPFDPSYAFHYLGKGQDLYLYADTELDYAHYIDFTLFILEATAESAATTAAAGGAGATSGKSTGQARVLVVPVN